MGYGEELEALWRYNAKQRSNVAESQHDVNARQAPKDRKQAVLRRRFDSLLGDGYDPEFLAPLKAAADLIDEQGAEILHLREQIAALESREVCTVAAMEGGK